jgi:hypothetical protein
VEESNSGTACSQGHPVPPASTFCPTCGERLTTAHANSAGTTGKTGSTTLGPAAAAASQTPVAGLLDRTGLSRKQALFAGVGALLFIAAIAVSGVLAGRDDEAQAGLNDGSTEVESGSGQSSHDTCTLQLAAIVTHLADDPDGAPIVETQVNGRSDPFFTEAMTLFGTFVSARVEVGTNEALTALLSDAEDVCTNTLGDAVRPNYPTDGSY